MPARAIRRARAGRRRCTKACEPLVSLPLQITGGDRLKLMEAYLLDAVHNAEAVPPPVFKNGDVIGLPGSR